MTPERPAATSTELEGRLREWLAEERRQALEAHAAAVSYHGVDIDAEVDLRRACARHRAVGDRIEKVLYAR